MPVFVRVRARARLRLLSSTMASAPATVVLPVHLTVLVNTSVSFALASPPSPSSSSALALAAAALRRGALVAFPTETVYGLGADARSSSAARAVFAAKARPADNPLIVHVASLAMLERVAHVPESARPLIARFWPGPLTLLLPARAGAVADEVTCGLPTVAVRMPAHAVARRLIEEADVPVAAPSANRSGRPSPTTAAHVLHDLDGRVPIILDGGPAQVGVESTVVDLQADPPALLRPGGVTYEQLRELLPTLRVYRKHFVDAELELHPTTPGMKYRHYSPDARVVLFDVDERANAGEERARAQENTGGEGARARANAGEEQARANSGGEGLGDGQPDAQPQALASVEERLHAAVAAEVAELQRDGAVPFAVVRTRAAWSYPGLVPWTADTASRPGIGIDYALGDVAEPEAVARGLFAALRDLDSVGVRVILVEGITDAHEGLAVMNRLRKAASEVRPV